jgi:DNA primase
MGNNVDIVEQIKQKLLISDIIGKKTRLQKKGNKLFGLCPFHNEKTPSFTVNDNKCFYYCFGCNASGDIFKFVMDTQGLDFTDSLKYLADYANITIPKKSGISKQYLNEVSLLKSLVDDVRKWFSEQLHLPIGKEALSYLSRRGIDSSLVKKFSLGYAPARADALYKHLLGKKYTEEQILKSGVMIKNERGDIYGRFRNRVIFPIANYKGETIAFGGRTLEDIVPKYLNSPETLLFKKSEILFAESLVGEKASKDNNIVVVEGYTDVVLMHAHGFEKTVATLGTAMTSDHLLKMWKYANEPIICLDGDEAGIKAMVRVAEMALPYLKEGYSLKFAFLPFGSDPDDVLKKEGRMFLQSKLDSAISLSALLWEVEYKRYDPSTPEQKSALEQRLMQLASKIKNSTISGNYKRYFQNKLWEHVKKYVKNNKKETNCNLKSFYLMQENTTLSRLEYSLMALALDGPSILKNGNVKEDFIRIDFSTPQMQSLQQSVLESFDLANGGNSDIKIDFLGPIKEKFGKDLEKLFSDELGYFDKIGRISAKHPLEVWKLTLYKYRQHLLKQEYKAITDAYDETMMQKLGVLSDELSNLSSEIMELEQEIDVEELI